MNTSFPADIESTWLTVNGLQIRSYALGSGEPRLLLHGGGVDGALLSWRLTMPALAAHRRVVGHIHGRHTNLVEQVGNGERRDRGRRGGSRGREG